MRKQVKNELLLLCGLTAAALYATRSRRAALLPVMLGGFLAAQRSSRPSFRGQSVVITGGSRGLGLALARELVHEGANVTLLARDADELTRARQSLEGEDRGEVWTVVCDVTDPGQLRDAFDQAAGNFGGIDLLINNAGAITVGPWETMEMKDFEAQMKLHLYSVIEATRLVLPYLRARSSGKRIVNICSMGGRVAVPHMLPYDTSKFALSGFSQGVGAELAHEGISVTTIYPALMRTGSPIQAVFKGDHEKEFAWFQSADVFPGLSISAQNAAKQIIQAARERRWELIPSVPGKIRMAVAAFFPELMGWGLSQLGRLLPAGQSRQYKTGAQSRRLFDEMPVTKVLVERARESERELNQTPKDDPEYNMGLLH